MLRIAFCVCIALIFSGCQKNWRGFVVEKRVYRDGYYIHIPWKRYTPQQAYPKPEPYPVDRTRTTRADTTKKNAGGVAGTGQSQSGNSQPISGDSTQSRGTGSGVSSGNSNPSYQPPNGTTGGNGGSGNPTNSTAVGSSGLAGTNGTNGNNQNVSAYPAPPLQKMPEEQPPLVRPVASVVPPDSAVAVVKPITPDTSGPGGNGFPDGEFSLVAELGFYNPVYISGIAVKPLSYNGGAALRYTIHPCSRHKLSGEFGLFISQLFIAQDQHKIYPLFTEDCDKERIMQWKSRFMLADHIYVSRKEDARFDAVEIGLFSELGFFSTHVAVTNQGNNENAMLTRNKSRLFGLHYLRRMQCGLTARVANDVWSVFANYRFSSLVKAVPDGGDLPSLVIGATFSFGE